MFYVGSCQLSTTHKNRVSNDSWRGFRTRLAAGNDIHVAPYTPAWLDGKNCRPRGASPHGRGAVSYWWMETAGGWGKQKSVRPSWFVGVLASEFNLKWASGDFSALTVRHGRNTAIWAAYEVYWAGDVTGVGVSSLFRFPATLDRNNSVTVAPTNFLFYYKKPEVESFRSRGRLSKSSKNWPRNENFCVIVSEVGWLSLKWYGGENVYNRDRQRPDSLANTDRALNWKKAK